MMRRVKKKKIRKAGPYEVGNASCIAAKREVKGKALTAADLPLEEAYSTHVAKALVDRKGLESDRSLMVSEAYLKSLKPGRNKPLCDRSDYTGSESHPYETVGLSSVPTLTLHAHWYTAAEKQVVTGKDANVFGKSGALQLIGEDIKRITIPVVDARMFDAKACAFFGMQLLQTKSDPVDLDTGHFSALYMVRYRFHKEYVEKYVLNKQCGGGLFVETHDFPHVFTPLSPACGGGLIIGKKLGSHHFMFVGVRIPHGYTLKINANVIHGDSFFTGPYGIALTEDLPADTVIMRSQVGEIVRVDQVDLTVECSVRAVHERCRKKEELAKALGIKHSPRLFSRANDSSLRRNAVFSHASKRNKMSRHIS